MFWVKFHHEFLGSCRSALATACMRSYAEGPELDVEALGKAMGGLGIVRSVASNNNNWAKKRYDRVCQHRAPSLPKDPWVLAIGENGDNDVAAALAVAIHLAAYVVEPSTKENYAKRHLPGGTIMLIAMGWSRLVKDTVKAYNLHATVSLDVPNILSIKSGPCVTFRNALDCTMKISGKRGLKISATHHRAPSDHEHYKAINSPGMAEEEARPHARRLCYLMGTHPGLRAGAEKYETTKDDMKFSNVVIKDISRAKLTWTPARCLA